MGTRGGPGVQSEYVDATGATVRADPSTVARATAALHAAQEESDRCAPLIVHRGDVLDARGAVRTEDRRTLTLEGAIPADMPLGYHRLDTGDSERILICSPGRCHLPREMRNGGWAVQLYAMRSRASWGVGDLGDLRSFGRWAAARGAGFALLNPLSASSPVPPVEPSPYLPVSRRFRNPLYLRVEDVPGAAAVGVDLGSLARQAMLLNRDRLIDRDQVTGLKLEALGRIHEAAPPGAEFRRWRQAQGHALRDFATFSALAEEHGSDWRSWPEELSAPDRPAVVRARRRLAGRVRFHAWLQWLIEQQLRSAAEALPLMQDLPIGVHPGGADVWADRELFATEYSVGAPPDLFNTRGQDWGQPPFDPWRLRSRGYAPFAAIIRAAFEGSQALRIDHVMGLFRLYWIPIGSNPNHGVYVRYPARDLLDILALESERAGGWVVGEDLGTVEPIVREEMSERDILSYRLLWFEGELSALPQRAMSAVTTHDLPTVAGVWTGADLRMQRAIGAEPNEQANQQLRERLLSVTGCDEEAAVDDVIACAYKELAASPSMAVVAALEDAAGLEERPNVPGTTGETHPNWSVALPAPLDALLQRPLVQRLAEIVGRRPAAGSARATAPRAGQR